MPVIDWLRDTYENLVPQGITWDAVEKWLIAGVVFLIAVVALRVV